MIQMAYETENGVVCEQCGNEYSQVGNHWVQSKDCEYPELPDVWKELLVGLLMGDGAVNAKSGANQRITVSWASKEQCQWVDGVFGWFTTGVKLTATATESAQKMEDSGINGNDYTADPNDFSDMYCVQTRSHPFITTLTDWYGESGYGDKVWPDDLRMTPTTLLLLYISDGSYATNAARRCIQITLENERDNEAKVCRYFERVGLPRPYWQNGGSSCDAIWTVAESKQLFEYMDQSPLMDDGVPDGFEYKFPTEYGGTGKTMSDVDL